ncbi:hypothetical protein KVA01_21570 [Kocuria varians]|uniref:Uncharacterized protein n=1 Tax=Kocuria varians TaxID=1272 RepID=A0A4Y4D6Q6_KOCVA|nr:hypothetical protein [Kocuria varians]GED00003.1 hypothetical protein KVA01_21570 [Kocuria varians]
MGDVLLSRDSVFSDPDLATGSATENAVMVSVLLGMVALILGFILFLGWRTFQGSQRARLTMIVLVTASQVTQMVAFFQAGRPSGGALLSASIDLLTVYALTSLSARAWTRGGAERARTEAAA